LKISKANIRLITELSVFPAVGLAIVRWVDSLDWESGQEITGLDIFPLLGLLAFTIMWWHFLVGFVAQVFGISRMRRLHLYSGYLVFILILMHPILLLSSLSPLGISVFEYVAPGQGGYIVLGYLSLSAFLLYDLARWLREKPFIKANWRIIDTIDDVAFIAIFIHAMNLGSHLQSGWLRSVWFFYGGSAIFFILFKHYKKITQSSSEN